MAIDTFFAFLGVYDDVADAKADYEAVKLLHTEAGLVIALFPAAAIGGGLLLATTGAGALLGSLAGHAAAGMSRKDLKEAGEALDEGTAGLVVVGVSDMQAKIEQAMKKAKKVEAKELKADAEAIEADAKS
jgi:hypothetical protein